MDVERKMRIVSWAEGYEGKTKGEVEGQNEVVCGKEGCLQCLEFCQGKTCMFTLLDIRRQHTHIYQYVYIFCAGRILKMILSRSALLPITYSKLW